jgi:hypothetical protein
MAANVIISGSQYERRLIGDERKGLGDNAMRVSGRGLLSGLNLFGGRLQVTASHFEKS